MLGGRIVETGGPELAERTAQAGLRPDPREVSRGGRDDEDEHASRQKPSRPAAF